MHDADVNSGFLAGEPPQSSSELTVEPVTPRRKGMPLAAWTVIVICVGVIMVPQFFPQLKQAEEGGKSIGLITMKMVVRYLIGAGEILGNKAAFFGQAQSFNTGPIDQRLRFLVVAGEMSGPTEALKQLKTLEEKIKQQHRFPTKTESKLLDILRRLYSDYERNQFNGPSLTADERTLLHKELDWFGDLALAPAEGPNTEARETVMWPAYRTVFVWVGVLGLAVLVGLAGLFGLVFFLVFLFNGKLKRGIQCGSLHGSVYAETFAMWLVLFLALSFASHVVPDKWLPAGTPRFFIIVFFECLSLSALLWPVLRGIPWRHVRWEIGFNLGRKPVLEPLVGIAGNAMSIPLLAIGLVVIWAILISQGFLQSTGSASDNFNSPDVPSHPIIKELANARWWEYLQLFFLASVVAPFIEETLFRGVLYRHLREATHRLGYPASVFLSAFVASFVFAAIHPQGPIAIPALMALAFMFSLLREWRGTLVPGMVAHGIHNGVLLFFSIAGMSD